MQKVQRRTEDREKEREREQERERERLSIDLKIIFIHKKFFKINK